MLSLKIDRITILLRCFDENSVMRFPVDIESPIGLTRSIKSDLAIHKQAQNIVCDFLGSKVSKDSIKPITIVEPAMNINQDQQSYLYLMSLQGSHFEVPKTWPTLASILRYLNPGPTRLVYNKAMQAFAGALEQEYHALELDEEVRLRLKQNELNHEKKTELSLK